MELDLRGLRVDDALDKLENWLEKCFSSGQPFGRVIHGKGTGALRESVRDALRHSSYVSTWERGVASQRVEMGGLVSPFSNKKRIATDPLPYH